MRPMAGFELIKNGETVRNFIFCKDPNGVYGAYETVGGEFYPYKEDVIDYIEDVGTQYIDTGIVLNKREEKMMDNGKFLEVCTQKVADYFNNRKDKTDNVLIGNDDVYVVWSCKTLQNNKALLSTTVPDGMYYELTYNGDKKELYMDAYKKWENICFEGVE